MSRVIRNDHPWTEDEIAYQLSRGRRSEVEKNRRDFPPGSKPVEKQKDSEPVEVSLTPEDFDRINNASEEELKAELLERKLPTNGDELELKVRLAQAVQAEY